MTIRSALIAGLLIASGCSGPDPNESGTQANDENAPCSNAQPTRIPEDLTYAIEPYPGPGETQSVACGGTTDTVDPYYVSGAQRFAVVHNNRGCGTKVQITSIDYGTCVVGVVLDRGPTGCYEQQINGLPADYVPLPLLPTSPSVALALFGTTYIGRSDQLRIDVRMVDDNTQVGPCASYTDTWTVPQEDQYGDPYGDPWGV